MVDQKQYKVLITDPDPPQVVIDILGPKYQLILIERQSAHSMHDEIIAKAKQGVDAILWATQQFLSKEILDAAGPNLKVVATMSVGVNNLNLDLLRKRSIKVANAPGVVDDAVADVAVLLLLAASRRMQESRSVMEKGDWIFGMNWMLGQDISGSTVGIVGAGSIGQAIVKRLQGFQVGKFLCTGYKCKSEKNLKVDLVPFDMLIQQSDFIISCCPLSPQTRNLFNKFVFSSMKKTAVFVNIGRSGVVNQVDLVQALKRGCIFAAGLDVMAPEPLPKGHELLTLPNCGIHTYPLLLPHLGSATYKTRNAMAKLAAQNILRGLQGKELLTPVIS